MLGNNSNSMNTKLITSILKTIIRDKQALYFSLVFPVILMFIMKAIVGRSVVGGMNYIDFVIPGLVTMTIVQLAVFSIAFVVAQQKEKGVIKRLFATPMTSFDFLSAQVVSRLVVSLIQTLLFIALAILIMSYTMKGSIIALTIVAILGTLVFLSLGFLVSGLSKSVETVPAIANLVIFPMIIFGNIFFPLDRIPSWLKPIVDHLPVKYLADGLRAIMTEGKSLFAVRTEALWLLVWLVVFSMIATKVFSFGTKK